ncbi:tRNA pseudouridine(55) synthase TruB [Arthrobacter echini]|uniref:tRNA pseudouridine synthase B n=1 Tax=Arthrobacter echini TaxID=1529066 RepID=A0A5D0XTF9_9MICC|nr:tRNA pseudouridine(55) synthase TruB [Arthrobacter echini]
MGPFGAGDRVADHILGGVNSGQVHSGLIIVDKPQGWTSHDVVGRLRRLAGTRKVGHAGTLDPMATGVLVIGINRATRLLTFIVGTTKTYTATIRLGQSTLTDDAEGEVTGGSIAAAVTEQEIHTAAAALTGDIQQVPSSVSAIKVKGERSYARVRAGQEVDLPARAVTVHRFEIHAIQRVSNGRMQDVEVTVECSSGTYIRALARDLGEALGVGGHLTALRRTRVGPYPIEQARTLDQLAESLELLPLDDAGRALFPVRELTDSEAADVSHGRRIGPSEAPDPVAAYAPDGTLVALLENRADSARTVLVFAPGGS